MATKHNALMAVAIIVASFAGGLVGQRVFPARAAFAQAGQAGQTVVAERFEVVDANGIVRIVLAVVDGAPGVDLYDTDGNALTGLGASTDGPILYMTDATTAGVILTVVDGMPAVSLAGADGIVRTVWDISEDGPGLVMRGLDETGILLLDVSVAGPALSLFDANSNLLWTAP